MLYITYCHHKVQENREIFVFQPRLFFHPVKAGQPVSAVGALGTLGQHPLLFLQLHSGNPAELQGLGTSGTWHAQLNKVISQYYTGRALCCSITGCYSILLQLTIIQIQRPQLVNKQDLHNLLAQANVYRHMGFFKSFTLHTFLKFTFILVSALSVADHNKNNK